MTFRKGNDIRPANGKLGVLLPGMGAVATTFVAGVEAIRRGHAKPIGSMTQMGTIRLGKRTDNRSPKIGEFVPLAGLDDLVFGGWDIFEDSAYESAKHAGVLSKEDLEKERSFLEGIRPMPGVFEPAYVKKLHGTYVKQGKSKMDLAEQLMGDIERFKTTSGADRCVAVWCGSTEVYKEPSEVHSTLAKFEKGLMQNDENIAPSAIYAYACLRAGVPYAN